MKLGTEQDLEVVRLVLGLEAAEAAESARLQKFRALQEEEASIRQEQTRCRLELQRIIGRGNRVLVALDSGRRAVEILCSSGGGVAVNPVDLVVSMAAEVGSLLTEKA